MIAVSRCVSLTSPDLGEKLFSGRNGKLIILMVWIYANLLVVPAYLGVSIYKGPYTNHMEGGKYLIFLTYNLCMVPTLEALPCIPLPAHFWSTKKLLCICKYFASYSLPTHETY